MYEIYEKLLKDKGIRTADVCRATGISSGTMSDWKNGRSVPKQDKIKKIADFFGVPIDIFYTDDFEVQTSGQQREYYNPETLEMAQVIYDNPDLHALMKAAMEAKKDAIPSLTQLLYTMKETNPDG